MKKLFIIIMLLLIAPAFLGCNLTTNSNIKEAGKLVTKMTVRTAAYYVAMNNPEVVEAGIVACNNILAEGSTDEVIKKEVLKILNNYQAGGFTLPPTVIVDDIVEVIALMGVEIPELPEGEFGFDKLNIDMVKYVAKAVKQGLEIAKAQR